MLTVHYSACAQRCQGRTGHGSTVQLSQECFHRDFGRLACSLMVNDTARSGLSEFSAGSAMERWKETKVSDSPRRTILTVAHHFSGGLACLKAARPGRDERFTPYARLAVSERQVTKRFDRHWRDGHFLLRLFPALDARWLK